MLGGLRMNVIEIKLKDVYILGSHVFGDHRGWFMESWSPARYRDSLVPLQFRSR